MSNMIVLEYKATEKLYTGDVLVIDIVDRTVSRYKKFQPQIVCGIAIKETEKDEMCPVYITPIIVCTSEKELSNTIHGDSS